MSVSARPLRWGFHRDSVTRTEGGEQGDPPGLVPWLAMALVRETHLGPLALEIDGQHAGHLITFEGGDAFAEVIETPNTGGPTEKSIGNAQYDDIVVTCPFPDGPLAMWVTEFLEGKAPEHDGAVILLDHNWQPVRRLDWQGGAIFSVAFPGLDATTVQHAGHVTIVIRPTTTKDTGGGRRVLRSPQLKTSRWFSGNFALSMPGIDCTRVIKVEPVVVTQTYMPGRGAPKPGPVHVSDLVVTVHQAGTSDFARWSEDFIVAGNNTRSHEKDATIRYLDRLRGDDLASLNVLSTGVFRVDRESQTAGVATSAQVRFSMYAEQVKWVKTEEPVVPPAAPTAQSSTDRDVRGVLGKRLAPAEVVRRLQEEPTSEQGPPGVDSERRLGREVGIAWAQRHASLAELREVAAADDQDWTSLILPEGHSLAGTLAATVNIPVLDDGRLVLPRGALAEGLIRGILEALAEVSSSITSNMK